MSDIQEKVKCAIGLTVALIIILVVLSIVYLGCNKNSNPVINSLTLIGSYAGAIATLAAAYIASFLYNDWRNTEKFKTAKDALIALIKLKSHLDNNYRHAKCHIDSYFLKDNQPLPNDYYITERLNDAKNCEKEKEKYKSELNILLASFFEKADIYEVLLNDILVKNEDREYNFQHYMFFIANMYTQAYTANLESIATSRNLASRMKDEFEEKYLNEMINKLKKNISIENQR